ncbi:hypothetical protein B2G52_09725 [Neisseria lactamica]|uniref:Uncharacterized protein n=2 Tax=Neisseria lactamica TaxID=486 RepID=A0AAU8VHZ0_NEILA|nr:hypothetical protein B2G52_09725 [Neisseria lactamica]
MLKPRPASQTAAISGRFVRRQTVFSPHKNNHTAQSGRWLPQQASAPPAATKGGFSTLNEMPVNKP